MSRRLFGISLLLMNLFGVIPAWGAPDDYIGDTAIYGGETGEVAPNVLIILDTSGSMNDDIPAVPYDSEAVYPVKNNCSQDECVTEAVYKWECSQGDDFCFWAKRVDDLKDVAAVCEGSAETPGPSLLNTGQFFSDSFDLGSSGECVVSDGGVYASGNWINWVNQSDGSTRPKIEVAREVVRNLVENASDIRFGLMVFDGYGRCWYDAEGNIVCSGYDGGKFLDQDGYTTIIKDMDENNLKSLGDAISGIYAAGGTPLSETLLEAMSYFRGTGSMFNHGDYPSPIEAHCQANYIILISDGMSSVDMDEKLATFDPTRCPGGDCDGDGFEPAGDPAKDYGGIEVSDYLDDVAYYMQHYDLSEDLDGYQNVTTYTVGFGLEGGNESAVRLLRETAENGGGKAFLANDSGALANALAAIVGDVYSNNTSFAAPVIPSSSDNGIFSGQRIYLGLFKPSSDGKWKGNIKKYGVDDSGLIVDKKGQSVFAPDGSVKDSATSYWSRYADGGNVAKGGAGELLLERREDRKIYTNAGTSPDLTRPENAFAKSNTAITAVAMGLASDDARNALIDYVIGFDAYDDNMDGVTSEKREWILGDILHSRPALVRYAPYNLSSEADKAANKSIIYAGANDGMLHAFRDADGKELWGFIPDNLLSDLKYLCDDNHTYYVDLPPAIYRYDADRDGRIEAGDKVILISGQRRGGGLDHLTAGDSRGAYYALDVTDPLTPRFLWKLDNKTAGFEELGETWSEPVFATVRAGGQKKIVAFFGAGYDNNEDLRFGNTQQFPIATGDTTLPGNSAQMSVSPSGGAQYNPKGRGIYAVQIASFDNAGMPTFESAPIRLWGHVYSSDSSRDENDNPEFSVPSQVAVLDQDYNGYADTLYAGDTGGNLWRCDISDRSVQDWSCHRIFSGNSEGPVSSNKVQGNCGRKIFYKPSVTIEHGYNLVFFGTGDRAHPLNEAVVDRIYAVKDRGQITATTESDLVDVTENILQKESLDGAELSSLGAGSLEEAIRKLLEDLYLKGGWFIKLDQNAGEKVLGSALAFNKVVYFTTYTPDAPNYDQCFSGNLGTGRLYAVKYKTGEAVFGYDKTNDSEKTENNERADGESGIVLRRSDRELALGPGIPSGVVVSISQGGDTGLMLGCQGGVCQEDTSPGGTVIPLFWLQK